MTLNGVVAQSVSRDEWDTLFARFADANYKQLAAYSEALASRSRANSEYVAIRKNGELIGICNVRVKRIPFLRWGIAYVNGAPLIELAGAQGVAEPETIGHVGERLSLCLRALRQEFGDRRGLVLRVIGSARAAAEHAGVDDVFAAAGFLPVDAKGSYRTFILDLSKDLKIVRAGLDRRWRNHLNNAERRGFELVRSEQSEVFVEYCALHRQLLERKQLFVDLGPDFFMALQAGLSPESRFVVHLAVSQGRVVAGHIGAFHGDTAVYLLGATSDEGLKCNASYFLQWQVIEYAKQRGCRWYDLGGIDREKNPTVYEFKSRMGGVDVSAPGPFESGPVFRRSVLHLLERAYRKARR